MKTSVVFHLFVSALSFAAACGTPRSTTGSPPAPVRAAASNVHIVSAPEAGIFVNAYVVEGPRSIVVIDSALRVSDADALRAAVQRIGKPLAAVFLTHGHPDHYNGLTALVADQAVPIYASAAVAQVIGDNDAAKEAQWKPMFGPEWPSARTFPTHVVANGQTIGVDGFELTLRDVGPAESAHDSIWSLAGQPQRSFIGDLVFNGMHSYLGDGHTAAWLKTLDTLERDLVGATLYPGHGAPGGIELFDQQRRYLTLYRDTVRRLSEGAERLSEAQRNRLELVMHQHVGNDRLGFLIGLGADAVATELAAEAKEAHR